MKILFLFFTLIYTSISFAGPNGSGGGGGGQFQLSSGYTAGQFDISVFSEKFGIVGTILKYYQIAGAVKKQANYFSYYELVGQTDSAILVNDPAPDMNGVLAPPEPKEEMQLNYRIAYSDLVRINSGSGEEMQVTSVEFKGSFAEMLYAAMEKGGAKYYSQYLDSHSQVIGFEYRDERLSCSRNTSYTWCEFNFIVDLK